MIRGRCDIHGAWEGEAYVGCPTCKEERDTLRENIRVTCDADRDRFCALALDRVSGKRVENWHVGPKSAASYVLTFLPRTEHYAPPVSVELAEGDLRMLAALLGRYL